MPTTCPRATFAKCDGATLLGRRLLIRDTGLTMPRSARPDEPHRTIFISLAVILAALLIYFALGAIPSGLRPTLSPSTNAPTTSAPTQP